MANTALTVIEDGAYALMPAAEIQELLRENLGNTKLDRQNLPQVKVPAGGGRAWDLGDDEPPVQELVGVVIWYADTRLYWSKGIEDTGGETPPDCASADGIVGIGDPGGECESCPLNEWGSGKAGRGKACNERRQLAILRPGELLPTMLSLPSASPFSSERYMAPGRDSKWVMLNSFSPTGSSEVKSASTETWGEPSALFTGWPFSSVSVPNTTSPKMSPLRASSEKPIG